MAQLLQAPTRGSEDAILIPEIVANKFRTEAWDNQYCPRTNSSLGHDKEDAACSYPLLQQDHLHNVEGRLYRALLLDKKNQASASAPAPAPVKAVELSCVTCGGAHSHQNCPATHGDVYRDNISEYVSQAAAANYNQVSNFRPQMVSNHIRPPALFPDLLNLHDTELADSINSKQMGIAKTSPDKVGVFHFSADCVVVRFDSRTPESFNSREMLIKRPVRALIAVIKGELLLV
ncbi:hypothetical protein Tco_0940372 [Tanacetum coccineum]|uniref:Uncharacterized protein n=1 Tax=Tanacetum coccineum TaxID=301880 RepID=A0ABQ5DNJ8_9ASTR